MLSSNPLNLSYKDNNIIMQDTINKLVVKEKGILAIDESLITIGKRFANINLDNTEQNRCKYRSLLATTKHLSNYISGVILFEETLTQKIYPLPSIEKSLSSITIPEQFSNQGILIGIKVDQGLMPIYPNSIEKITKGLDNLVDDLNKYKNQEIKFAKWRSVISINVCQQLPSKVAIHVNVEQLARYAAVCQNLGIVPIVEPEVLMEGDHNLEECAKITQKVLIKIFKALKKHQVNLEYMILKTNMILPGKDCKIIYSNENIAEATLKVLKTTVPAIVPSINFLSGGQSAEEATSNLNAINKLGIAPWHLSFSFGRALQETCLATWAGEDNNIKSAQIALLERAKLNSLANLGQL